MLKELKLKLSSALPKVETDKVQQKLNWFLRVVEVAFFITLVVGYFDLRKKSSASEPAIAKLAVQYTDLGKNLNGVVVKFGEALVQVRDDLHSNLQQSNETMKNTRDLAASANRLVARLDTNLNGGKDENGVEVVGLLPVATRDLVVFGETLGELKTAIQSVSGKVNGGLDKLTLALDNVATLVKTANDQIKGNGDELQGTLKKLAKAIEDLDQVATDPHIQELLAHVEGTSGNIEGITDKLNKIMEPFAKHRSTFRKLLPLFIGALRLDVAAIIHLIEGN